MTSKKVGRMRKMGTVMLCLGLILASGGMMGGVTSAAGTVTYTGASGVYPSISGSIIAFQTYESDVGQDLNGDGATKDVVVGYYDISSGSVINTGAIGVYPSISGSIIAFQTYESDVGQDLNGDGDQEDVVVRYYDISSGSVINTGAIGVYPSISGSIIAFQTYESDVGQDLNGDGDQEDYVVRYYDILSGAVVNTSLRIEPPPPRAIGPDYRPSRVFGVSISGHVITFSNEISVLASTVGYYDISTGLAELRVAYGSSSSISGSIIAFQTYEGQLGQDLNGDGDQEDYVVRYYDISSGLVVNTTVAGRGPSISGSIIAFQTCECPDATIGYINIQEAPTIPDVSDQVDNFYDDGSIDNVGIVEGLQALLEQAQAMIDRGNTKAAGNKLQAFINLVSAQSGKHITTEAAQTLIESAQSAIDSL